MIIVERSAALVLQMRFGDARRVMPQTEVARRVRLSVGTVRRVERAALRRLRNQALAIAERGDDWDEV